MLLAQIPREKLRWAACSAKSVATPSAFTVIKIKRGPSSRANTPTWPSSRARGALPMSQTSSTGAHNRPAIKRSHLLYTVRTTAWTRTGSCGISMSVQVEKMPSAARSWPASTQLKWSVLRNQLPSSSRANCVWLVKPIKMSKCLRIWLSRSSTLRKKR